MLRLQPDYNEARRAGASFAAFHYLPQKRRGQSVFGVTKRALILLLAVSRVTVNIDADESDYATLNTMHPFGIFIRSRTSRPEWAM